MPKERSINPAQAQRKAEKAKAVKKGKAEALSRRNEKLARRNPDRLQRQLADLQAIETSGGKLTNHERNVLEGLEKELAAVRKAREALGDSAPKFGSAPSGNRGGFGGAARGGRGAGVLGKRRREDEGSSSDGEVPDDVRRIPMPRDTPPPIPKDVLDRWYQARRERRGRNGGDGGGRGSNANITPLGRNDRRPAGLAGLPERPGDAGLAQAPAVEAKTVYEAKPVLRDLRKEAVSFVPAAVRVKMEKGRGVGGLVEPEEADRLEREGYIGRRASVEGSGGSGKGVEGHANVTQLASRRVMMEEVEDEDG